MNTGEGRGVTFTMDWVRARCESDEDSGCAIWQMGTNPGGAPIATKLLPTGKKPTFQIRRVVWEHRHGPIPDGMLVTCSCRYSRCLTHLELVTKAEVVKRQWKKSDARAKLTASVTKASRQRAKLDMEKAQAIRNSNGTLVEVAAEHGISVTLASLVRRGERWREIASPFAGLGA